MPPKSDDVCDDTSTAAGSRFGKEMDGFFCLRVVNKVAPSSYYYYRFWGICKSNMYTAEAFFFFFFFSRKRDAVRRVLRDAVLVFVFSVAKAAAVF